MVKFEQINEKLFRHYSDEGKALRQIATGLVCAEAFETKSNVGAYEEVDTEGDSLKI